MEIFGNWREAVVVAEKWRKFYNGERPHSSLGYQTPDEFKKDWERRQRLLKSERRKKLASQWLKVWGLDSGNYKVWFRCPKDNHSWEKKPSDIVTSWERSKTSGCPVCAGKINKPQKQRSLAEVFPQYIE